MSKEVIQRNYDAYSNFYNNRPRTRFPEPMFLHYFTRYVMPDKSVKRGLSVGCGDGAHEFLAAREGIGMTCVDLHETVIERIQKWAQDEGLSIKTGIANQTDLSQFADDSFDLVISWSVVSYGTLETGKKAISEIYRVLRKGGYFLCKLESSFHTGYKQSGVRKIGDLTYQMPENAVISHPGMILTYYDEKMTREVFSKFTDLKLALNVLYPPNMLDHQVGQWLIHCRK